MRTRGTTATTPAAIEEAAAEWLVRRKGGLSPDAAAQFDAWWSADARHWRNSRRRGAR